MVSAVDRAIREGGSNQNKLIWEAIDRYVQVTSRKLVADIFREHGREYIRKATLDTLDRLLKLPE
jgi:hypothetical protein